jgi:hypothetical protein
MKESKIIIFDEDSSEKTINEKIGKLAEDGWEIVEHRVAMCMGTVVKHSLVIVLLQREKK